MNNGLISDFPAVKRDLALAVDPTLFLEIEGSTDSKLLFFLALTFGLEGDPPTAVARAVGLVEATGRRHGVAYPVQMTVATSNGDSLLAFRYSSQGQSRRSSTASTSSPCVTSIRTTRRCTSSPAMRASSCPSRWEIYAERGGRCPSRRV